MYGMFSLLIGIVELVTALLMLVFTIAFGIEHPLAAVISLFICFGVASPIWCTLKKSYRKQVRRQQVLRAKSTAGRFSG